MHLLFWGKIDPARHDLWKPVAHHCLDVAATASAFLEHNPARLARECRLYGLPPAVHSRVCGFFAGLHDLGKFARFFQGLSPDHWPTRVLGPAPPSFPRQIRHWEATAILLNHPAVTKALEPAFGLNGAPRTVIAAIAGHHGRPPRARFLDPGSASSCYGDIGEACIEAASAFVSDLVALFDDVRSLPELEDEAAFSFALNGLTTLADWVGSDADYFGFAEPETSVRDYWPLAVRAARRAIVANGLGSTPVSKAGSDFGALRDRLIPRPMQVEVADMRLRPEPQIAIIEDGTGSGKTEAALVLARRMMEADLGDGVFMAMPTMATANAMHDRLGKAIPFLFDGPATLILAHGKAAIASALDKLAVDAGGTTDETAVSHWLSAWIADSRKKAFFADAGAGTIDQAFLSVLPKKHLTMRQYALAGRILIVDEAHACDAYMGEELKTLLEMHARLGGSAIILSATLSQAARRDFVKSFAYGRGMASRGMASLGAGLTSHQYPLLTRWSKTGGAEEVTVEPLRELSRSVAIERIDSRNAVAKAAIAAAGAGAAVAIICNAVDPAIETWKQLLAEGHNRERCHLFHARFLVDDRLAIEERVQCWFGRTSESAERNGRILVATQVVEQSLDVDFDVVFTDLAPADLVVQRAGRLWRHKRGRRPVEQPQLYLLTPSPEDDIAVQWLQDTLGAAAHVYDLPGAMWRTARKLLARGRLDTPGDLRGLIEGVYSRDGDDLPAALRQLHDVSLGISGGHRTLARNVLIRPDGGYAGLPDLSSDEEIGTRLGEKSVTIRLARRENGRLIPFCRREGASDRLNWALSEIAVRKGWWERGGAPEPADKAAVDGARQDWPEWERSMALFEVGADGRVSVVSDMCLAYSVEAGLTKG